MPPFPPFRTRTLPFLLRLPARVSTELEDPFDTVPVDPVTTPMVLETVVGADPETISPPVPATVMLPLPRELELVTATVVLLTAIPPVELLEPVMNTVPLPA
jgi:hypothetical protein